MGAALLGGTPAWAQDAGDGPDASWPDGGLGSIDAAVPDASVGAGGADRTSQESDDGAGRTARVCSQTSDCDKGFVCDQYVCRWTGYRTASGGCLLGTSAALTLALAGLALQVRRR